MSFVRELQQAENRIAAAVKRHGDVRWEWASTKANPNMVPIIWNDIRVFSDTGRRVVPAIDYVEESE